MKERICDVSEKIKVNYGGGHTRTIHLTKANFISNSINRSVINNENYSAKISVKPRTPAPKWNPKPS